MPDLSNIADLHHLLNMKPGILVFNTNYLKKKKKIEILVVFERRPAM